MKRAWWRTIGACGLLALVSCGGSDDDGPRGDEGALDGQGSDLDGAPPDGDELDGQESDGPDASHYATGPGIADKLPAAEREIRGLILISLDTLRSDHLGCYGYPRPTSPELDRFAERATLYTRARSTASWTLPSHASMFTGLYPFEHGARTCALGETPYNNVMPLSREHLTLAELFHENGWTTAAFVANHNYLDPRYRLDQGFDLYDVEMRTSKEMLEDIVPWLRNAPEDRPFFLFLNFMDTHRPYNCRQREEFPYHGTPRDASQLVKSLYPLIVGRKEVPPELMTQLVDMYDTAIANLDESLGELFARLRRLELWDDVGIVITSDHGEFLGEHALIEHSKDVYEAVLQVPLIVKAPGQTEGEVDDGWISSVHVPALLLQFAHLERLPQQSAAFVRHWPRDPSILAANRRSRQHDLRKEFGERFQRDRRVVYFGDWKYIDSSDGDSELFHVIRDPEEQHDQLAEELEFAELGRQELARLWVDEVADSLVEDLTPAERRRLEAMGYIAAQEDEDDGGS